jgi:hypothetical protein
MHHLDPPAAKDAKGLVSDQAVVPVAAVDAATGSWRLGTPLVVAAGFRQP